MLCHCSDYVTIGPSQMRVVVGEHDRSKTEGTESIWAIDRVFIHPYYDVGKQYTNDIALIRLKGSIEYRREVASVCLPKTEVLPGTQCVATGWGQTRGEYHSSLPQQSYWPNYYQITTVRLPWPQFHTFQLLWKGDMTVLLSYKIEIISCQLKCTLLPIFFRMLRLFRISGFVCICCSYKL